MDALKLRYKEDSRSLIFIGLTLVGLISALWPDMKTTSIWSIIGINLSLSLLCYICHTINHNHIHIPIFVKANTNNVFSVFLSIAQGLSSKSLIVTHNLNHHVHLAKPTDWFHDGQAGKGWGVIRLFRYVANVWFIIFKERYSDPTVKLSTKNARLEKIENLGILSFSLLCLWLNWRAYLYIVLPSWMMASFYITAINLLQHEGCDPYSKYGHSRNYMSRFGNWIFFNGGYHSAHHTKPSVHWTKLPEYHAEIAHLIPEHLYSKSTTEVVFKKYIFSYKA